MIFIRDVRKVTALNIIKININRDSIDRPTRIAQKEKKKGKEKKGKRGQSKNTTLSPKS